MTLKPRSLDTIVATALHGDILSDIAGALAGGLGGTPPQTLSPIGLLMFEPIHDSAFDVAGKGIANSIATFCTAARMREHRGESPAAIRLMRAVETVSSEGVLTPDVRRTATPHEAIDDVCRTTRGSNA
ncbi:isocitrate/isopropylmalate dehydrogenase [Mesorhizobium abyssinicae]